MLSCVFIYPGTSAACTCDVPDHSAMNGIEGWPGLDNPENKQLRSPICSKTGFYKSTDAFREARALSRSMRYCGHRDSIFFYFVLFKLFPEINYFILSEQ